ncbi:hypothetical protein [Halomonas nitroreducens]|uniref:DUF892 family protein n=1 Tax=Halomonas nitroreducens TaxID=447425 RepID=A0A431V8X2_9GAMM|nr:hypothetical protein [Halomonas nitroreducens]RTR07133.1 hypothetical protein EKG36_01395 [Halomonas nitroreducens]
MNDMTILTLLPQERLMLASGLENRDLQRYRRLAQGFASGHADISRVMEGLGVACEQQLKALLKAAERMELGACVTRGDEPAEGSASIAGAQALPAVDARGVNEVLEDALEAADEASRLSRLLLDTNATPELEMPLMSFARHKQEECGVLRECLTVHAEQAAAPRRAVFA